MANPAKGSGHNRGLAVDLTMIDLKTGKELDMGTGFDNFTDTAHHAFTKNLPEAGSACEKIAKRCDGEKRFYGYGYGVVAFFLAE